MGWIAQGQSFFEATLLTWMTACLLPLAVRAMQRDHTSYQELWAWQARPFTNSHDPAYSLISSMIVQTRHQNSLTVISWYGRNRHDYTRLVPSCTTTSSLVDALTLYRLDHTTVNSRLTSWYTRDPDWSVPWDITISASSRLLWSMPDHVRLFLTIQAAAQNAWTNEP